MLLSVPAVLAGRSWRSVLTVYQRQAENLHRLTWNAASVYQWLPEGKKDPVYAVAGVAFAAAVCAFFGYVLGRLSSKRPTKAELLQIALFMSALPPLFLPAMHERYAFVSDTIATVVPFVTPSLTAPCLLLIGASLASYGPYLGHTWVPLQYVTLVNVVALALVARTLATELGVTATLLRDGSAPSDAERASEDERRRRSGEHSTTLRAG